ncbi:MAG TPA: hypothetical protein VF826_03775 [Chloroflexia bacterium]|jgi:hypothetical protein
MAAPERTLMRVYSRSIWGERLVSWVAGGGYTYRQRWLRQAKRLTWTVSNSGKVYLWAGPFKGLAGWVYPNGSIYDRYLLNYDNEYSNRPGLSGYVTPEGQDYRLGLIMQKHVGRVEGTEDIHIMGGLALLLVLRR